MLVEAGESTIILLHKKVKGLRKRADKVGRGVIKIVVLRESKQITELVDSLTFAHGQDLDYLTEDEEDAREIILSDNSTSENHASPQKPRQIEEKKPLVTFDNFFDVTLPEKEAGPPDEKFVVGF